MNVPLVQSKDIKRSLIWVENWS